ncbi:hypothetical protein ABID21_004839 [Pseudorhizobium tarimense]|uniref:Uncharacterized protein n=2 Tax=Pseudorhizobium tarimense TaxID=1079109 RepID=A0ABV2HDU8_9HYPH
MMGFFETAFGPAELEILEAALAQWCRERLVDRLSPEAAIAAEVFINLFREGNRTSSELQEAAGHHKWLMEWPSASQGTHPTEAKESTLPTSQCA